MRARILGGLVAAVTLGILVLIAEVAVRILDGVPLSSIHLPAPTVRAGAPTGTARDAADERHVAALPVTAGVDRAWYPSNPTPRPRKVLTAPMAARAEKYKEIDPIGAFFAWNRVYLTEQLCQGSKMGSLGILDDFYVFDPPSRTPYPPYRHLSSVSPPEFFVSNNFGWRGPDIAVNKPADTIRIAFVGSSMTIDPFGQTFSHIEFIANWLELWARSKEWPHHFEVINSARTGIAAPAAAAIVAQELAPLEPDLVVFDGANDFKPGIQFDFPADLAPPSPPPQPWRSERFSALARRLHIVARRADNGEEPPKPRLRMKWPDGVDKQNPDPSMATLPMDLATSVRAFDDIRATLNGSGGTLVLSSTVGLVADGLRLQLPRDQSIYDHLNKFNYPLTYAQTRELLDFQNRLYERYAERHQLPFVDKARLYPADPELFADTFHMSPPGLRLKAWIYFQWLTRWLEPEITAGRLPKAMQHPVERHPNFPIGDYPIVPRSQILAGCKS